jgi:hypothetical protein
MTPRDIDQLTSVEYHALWDYVERDVREQEREQRRAARRRR